MKDIDKCEYNESILQKYSSLFQEKKLDNFYKNIEIINNRIKQNKDDITVFFYIKNQDGEIFHAREFFIELTSPKKIESFLDKFENFYQIYYKYINLENINKLFISYCIVPHKIYKDYSNYHKKMELNKIFSTINGANFSGMFLQGMRKNFIDILKIGGILYSLISLWFVIGFLSKIYSIPIQTMYFNVISLIIAKYMFLMFLGLLFILVIIYFLSIGISFLIKKLILNEIKLMKYPFWNNSFSLWFMLLIMGTVYFITQINVVNEIEKEYFIRTQIPSILKIKNTETKKTQNILYLGTDNMVNYFTDYDINNLISNNEKSYKLLCMGKDKGYVTYLLPLINKQIISNKVYRRILKRNIYVFPDSITFHDAFCFYHFPNVVKKIGSDKNETILLMGIEKEKKLDIFGKTVDANTSLYYSENQIKKIMQSNNALKKKFKNEKAWIKFMMESKNLINIPYQQTENLKYKDINLTNEFQ